jgi:hypothetical protein
VVHPFALRIAISADRNSPTLVNYSTRAKMEVATKEEMNPIAQDTKKGKLRSVEFHNRQLFAFGEDNRTH